MKKFFKNDIYLLLTLLFLILLFKNNTLFKNCILEGCNCFFKQVFPTLFPMFIINDILISYNFVGYLNQWFHKLFYKVFHFSNAATYIFIMSMFSGTPTNGYIATNLVKTKHLNPKEASVILSYSFFLNPLFLYSMLSTILNSEKNVIQFILISYSINFLIAFFYRNYPYQNITLEYQVPKIPFSMRITKSINQALQTLLMILGTMIFYFIICEGINLIIPNDLINCIMNGLLEVTGGLTKLNKLFINISLKKIIAGAFISFGGLSIHSQIKSIITDANISYKPFIKARIIATLLSTTIYIIIS